MTPSPLLGQAIGDALGMPFETQTRFSSELLSWDGSYRRSDYHRLSPGQWTDDTMMAKLLAESLVERGSYDPQDAASRYLAWYRSGDFRGMGKSTMAALSKLDRGTPWVASGVPKAEGNGTAMRVIPLGVFYRYRPHLIVDAAGKDAGITHLSIEAIAGSIAIAYAAALLTADSCKPVDLPARLLGVIPAGSNVSIGVRKLVDALDDGEMLGDFLIENGTGAHVVQTVPAALAVLAMTRTYRDCVEQSIRAGGDTDTTAAIAGGLAGLAYGRESIPAQWITGLDRMDELRQLEERLLT